MAGTMYVEPDVVEMLFGAPQQASDHEDWRYDSDEILNALYNDSDTICMSTELASQDGLRGTNNTIWDLIDGHRDSSSRVPERYRLVSRSGSLPDRLQGTSCRKDRNDLRDDRARSFGRELRRNFHHFADTIWLDAPPIQPVRHCPCYPTTQGARDQLPGQ